MVGLGNSVTVGVEVGGMAAWVSALMVLAITAAEACIWTGSIVGAAWEPHALSNKVKPIIM